MKPKLKICGMRDWKNILAVAALEPDMMGFIFYPPSPRYVGEGFQLPVGILTAIKKIGVFVNATTDEMLKQTDLLGLDYLQLHGHETISQCEELKRKGARVIKTFSVDDDFDFEITRPYEDKVDYFLFDTKGKYYGGNARTFNWDVLNNYNQQVPFFLSGGISVYNIPEIKKLENMNVYAIDVNSGVESSPGVKDIEKIKDLMCEL